MFFWLILMLIGLGALGFAFYEVYTSKEETISKKQLVFAGVGALISVVGLVMTIRSLQKEPSPTFAPPQPALQKTEEKVPTVVLETGETATPEISVSELEVGGGGIPQYDPQKYPEDPNGPIFTAEEINQFITRANSLVNALEDMVTNDKQLGDSEDKEARGLRWLQFETDFMLKVKNLVASYETKNGPGTGKARQMMFVIGSNLTKMQRVYHNAACFNDELDLHYISLLRSQNEKLMKELQKMFPQ